MKTTLLTIILAFGISILSIAQNGEQSFQAAERFFKSGNYEKAIEHYSESINQNPNNLNAYLRRAFCYSATKNYEGAIKDYSKIIENDPTQLNALNSRGSAYNKLEKYDNAMKDFNKIIAIDPNYSEAYNNRGWAKKFTGDKKGACADWKKSKKLGNGEAKIILNNNGC